MPVPAPQRQGDWELRPFTGADAAPAAELPARPAALARQWAEEGARVFGSRPLGPVGWTIAVTSATGSVLVPAVAQGAVGVVARTGRSAGRRA